MSWCHAGQQGSPRSGCVAATDASRVRLPRSEGLFFASGLATRRRRAAATDPFELYRGLGQRVGRAARKRAALSANVRGLTGISRSVASSCGVSPLALLRAHRRRGRTPERRRQRKRPWHRRVVREKLCNRERVPDDNIRREVVPPLLEPGQPRCSSFPEAVEHPRHLRNGARSPSATENDLRMRSGCAFMPHWRMGSIAPNEQGTARRVPDWFSRLALVLYTGSALIMLLIGASRGPAAVVWWSWKI